MESFPVDPLTSSVNESGYGIFAWLPVELREEILFQLCEHKFPFGVRHLPSPDEAIAAATAEFNTACNPPNWNIIDDKELEKVKKDYEKFVHYRVLPNLRASLHRLTSLAATSKVWYMAVRRLYPLIYRMIGAYYDIRRVFYDESRKKNSLEILLIMPMHAMCRWCSPERQRRYMVAAVHLMLWPDGKRVFLNVRLRNYAAHLSVLEEYFETTFKEEQKRRMRGLNRDKTFRLANSSIPKSVEGNKEICLLGHWKEMSSRAFRHGTIGEQLSTYDNWKRLLELDAQCEALQSIYEEATSECNDHDDLYGNFRITQT